MKWKRLFVLLFLLELVLSGCKNNTTLEQPSISFEIEEYQDGEKSENRTASYESRDSTKNNASPSIPTNPSDSVRQSEEIFLHDHIKEMTTLAEMMLAAETDQITYQYTPETHRLDWFKSGSYYTQGQITEHPILDAAFFLRGTEVFDGVCVFDYEGVWGYNQHTKACVFYKPVHDTSGNLLFWAKIAYCTSNVSDIPIHFEELLPNSYFYLEDIPD